MTVGELIEKLEEYGDFIHVTIELPGCVKKLIEKAEEYEETASVTIGRPGELMDTFFDFEVSDTTSPNGNHVITLVPQEEYPDE